MATVKQVYEAVDRLAPFDLQMSLDNAGFLVGRGDRRVSRILVALDITEPVVAEAAEWGAEVIVAHHPVIFQPARSVTSETSVGRIVLALAEQNIAAICAHTNLDAVQGGVNDALARAVGLTGLELLVTDGVDGEGMPYGIGRVGTLMEGDSPSLPEYARRVKKALNANGVRFVDTGVPVRRVAVGGGACGDMVKDAIARGCDTFVTSDLKYHEFLEARAMGINLVDAGHYPTENVVCPVLAEALEAAFPSVKVRISACHREVFSYL